MEVLSVGTIVASTMRLCVHSEPSVATVSVRLFHTVHASQQGVIDHQHTESECKLVVAMLLLLQQNMPLDLSIKLKLNPFKGESKDWLNVWMSRDAEKCWC